MRRGLFILGSLLAAAGAAGAQTPGFWLTGVAPGGGASWVESLSADGSVAAGHSYVASGPIREPAFRWTTQGRDDFGLLPGSPAYTHVGGMSSDGNILAGFMADSTVTSEFAYRRVGNGPLTSLGLLPGNSRSYARGISGDGNVVVGACEFSPQHETSGQAFRWTAQTGMQGLGFTRPTGTFSEALAISRDSSTIVGWSQSGGGFGPVDAFAWTQGGGMRALPLLSGAPTSAWSHANAANIDGRVIVGDSVSAITGTSTAVRWTDGGAQDLGSVPGFLRSFANAMDDTGDVVGGIVYTGLPDSGFVWTPGAGAQLLSVYLSARGIEVPAGYHVRNVLAISGDGLTFAGIVDNPGGLTGQGFVATVPPPSSIFVLLLPALARWRRPAA